MINSITYEKKKTTTKNCKIGNIEIILQKNQNPIIKNKRGSCYRIFFLLFPKMGCFSFLMHLNKTHTFLLKIKTE